MALHVISLNRLAFEAQTRRACASLASGGGDFPGGERTARLQAASSRPKRVVTERQAFSSWDPCGHSPSLWWPGAPRRSRRGCRYFGGSSHTRRRSDFLPRGDIWGRGRIRVVAGRGGGQGAVTAAASHSDTPRAGRGRPVLARLLSFLCEPRQMSTARRPLGVQGRGKNPVTQPAPVGEGAPHRVAREERARVIYAWE